MGNKNPRSAYFSPKNWLWGSVSGLNGKRYSQLPVLDYEVNDDGTITAYGGTYNVSTDAYGRKYFDVLIPEYDRNTGKNYLNRGFDHIDSSGRVMGRGETYNRYYIRNLIPKTVEIPERARENVTVKDGKTFYTFPGYNTEDIMQAVLSVLENNKNFKDDNVYRAPQLLQTEQEKVDGTIPIEEITHREFDNKAPGGSGILYAYPQKIVRSFNISPQLYPQVIEALKNTKTPTTSEHNKEYIFSSHPLNLTEGYVNDSLFYNIDTYSDLHPEHTDPRYGDKVLYNKQGELQGLGIPLGQNIYAIINKEVPFWSYIGKDPSYNKNTLIYSPYDWGHDHGKRTVKRNTGKDTFDSGEAVKFPNALIVYDNPRGPYAGRLKYPFIAPPTPESPTGRLEVKYKYLSDFAKGGKLSNYGIPVQSWSETSQLLKPQNTTAQARTSFTEGLKNIDSLSVSDFRSLFKHKLGGLINYYKFYK